MIQTLRNAWKIPDLRKKILFTIFALLIYRFGSNIPVPFINATVLQELFTQTFQSTIFGLMNNLAGGAMSKATIFALSIQPYINASIIMNLLTVGIPALERMQKEGGEEGRKKIAAITRYVTVVLGLLIGYGYYTFLRTSTLGDVVVLEDTSFFTAVVIILTFTAGSAFIMWLGEQITEFGIGNGISMILFASIISRGPAMVTTGWGLIQSGAWYWVLLAVVVMLAIVAFVVYITQAERRIPIQYAKRLVGRKMYGGQSTYLPLKVNMSGVMPIIFASSIASLPSTIATFARVPQGQGVNSWFGPQSFLYPVVFFLLIIAFSYFYSTIQFNPIEVANNLKNNGGSIPGFRSGKPTADFIRKVLNKVTLFGAIFLGVIALLPLLMAHLPNMSAFAMGGTSVLIVVGVALETVKAIEAQMVMRHHKGFLE